MSNLQNHFLRIEILKQLFQVGAYKLPEKSLFLTMNTVLDLVVSESQVQEALRWLKDKAYVDFTVEELTEEKRWFITESGRQKLPQ